MHNRGTPVEMDMLCREKVRVCFFYQEDQFFSLY
jgi:hypothetical protein